MRREGLRGLLQFGFFITGLSACSLLFQPRDSGEFVLSVCSLGMGLLILLVAVLFILTMR